MLNHAARVDAVDAAPVVRVERQRNGVRRRERDVALALPAAGRLDSALSGIHFVGHVVAELVEAHTGAEHQAIVQEAQALLRVACAVGDVRVGARRDAGRHAAFAWIQADIDLVVVEVGAAVTDGRMAAPSLCACVYCVLSPSCRRESCCWNASPWTGSFRKKVKFEYRSNSERERIHPL